MSDDEYIRGVTVGELRPLAGPVVLAPYDPHWPALFERESIRIRTALGEQVLQLEHVGSTAVPGLAAKPTVDVLLVVSDSADEASYGPALEAHGYTLRIREPDWYQHRMFKGPDIDINLHVLSWGCPEIDRMLTFRDRLRTDDSDRDLYARTKQFLAQQDWRYTQQYAAAKSAIVEQILARPRP